MPEQKKLNKELVEELAGVVNQWVIEHIAPGSGTVVITSEKTEGGVTKTVASAAIVEDSKVEWDGGGAEFPTFLSTRLQAEGLALPIICEDKPEPVILADMWQVFETQNYLTQKVREDIEYAVSRNETVKPVSWVCLPGLGTGANVPGGVPRKVLESVFLAHAYAFLRAVVADNRGMASLVTCGVNRPEITGLSKIPKVVRAGDGRSVRDVLGAVALELSVRGVELDDGFQESILVDNASAKAAEIAADKAAKYWE